MRADRLLSLLALLQNHRRITAAELAERLAVSVRTVQRDIDVLSAAGIPVYAERGRGGGVRLHGGFSTRLGGLSREESEAIALVSAPSVLADLHIDRQFDSAVEKMAAAIPAVHQLRARHVRNRLMVDTEPWFREAAPDAAVERLEALRRAVWSDAVCRLDYRRGDGTRKRYRAEAHALVAKVDLWYLVARTRQGMRVFRLSRIQHLEVTGDRFARDPHFDLPAFWKRWCRRFEADATARYWVTLSLTAAGRERLRERYGGWHVAALAQWDTTRARNVVTLDLENADIAARVVFDLAGEGHVLQPEPLREAIRAQAAAVLEGLSGALTGGARPKPL